MAKKSSKSASAGKQSFYPDEFYMQASYGLLIGVLGIIWMAKEVGWLHTNIPIGPFIIIILGLMIVFARIKRKKE